MCTTVIYHRFGHEDTTIHIPECRKHTATCFDVEMEEEKRWWNTTRETLSNTSNVIRNTATPLWEQTCSNKPHITHSFLRCMHTHTCFYGLHAWLDLKNVPSWFFALKNLAQAPWVVRPSCYVSWGWEVGVCVCGQGLRGGCRGLGGCWNWSFFSVTTTTILSSFTPASELFQRLAQILKE